MTDQNQITVKYEVALSRNESEALAQFVMGPFFCITPVKSSVKKCVLEK